MKKFLFTFIFTLVAASLFSQWSTNPAVNNPVTSLQGNQKNVTSCPDGAGGIIMSWEDNSGGSNKVMAQKINIFGQTMWAEGGIGICSAMGDQLLPSICSDAAGGAIVYWIDHRAGITSYDYYAQRIRTDGLLMWDANGVKVNNLYVTGTIYRQKCITAEAGASIIAWSNSDSLESGLLSQKLDAYGVKVWNPVGVFISHDAVFNFDLCLDGTTGAYYTWSEIDATESPKLNLYAQHLNTSGTALWNNKKTVSSEHGSQYDPAMCEDQNGGFIVTWLDNRVSFYNPPTNETDVFAAHFDTSGTNLWSSNGAAVCTEIHDQVSPFCISDLHGGAHIFWLDSRYASINGYAIYGQNINYNGVQRWTSGGKKIADKVDFTSTADGRFSPQLAGADALGGAIVCWTGYSDAALTQYGLLAQKIDYYGVIQWDPNGIIVSSDMGKSGPTLTFDGGSGGCTIAWTDDRQGSLDVYAQHVKSTAGLGNYRPKPIDKVKTDMVRQNYPNPFNPTTNIAYSLVNDANISIRIFDMSGRELEVLVDGFVTAGDHSVTWNANKYASGTYFYKFTNGNKVEVKKMFLVK